MKIFFCVGDASADVYAANLALELKKRVPGVQIEGNGGKLLEGAGVKLYVNLVEHSVMGITEVIKNYSRLVKIVDETAKYIADNKFDLVILMDYPGFNLKLAAKLKEKNIKTVYYILPQLWAWGKGRIKKVKKFIAKCFVVFPFETAIFEKEKIPVEFNGHPLVDLVHPSAGKEALKKEFKIPAGKKVIGLFPGSRKNEINSLLPEMLEASKIIDSAEFVLCQAVSISDELIQPLIKASGAKVTIVKARTYDVMEVSDAVVLASGTVTLEAALMEKPMVVVYKLSLITRFIGKLIVKIKYMTLPNILAGKLIVPELLHDQANRANIFLELEKLIEETPERIKMLEEIRKLKRGLGEQGVNGRITEGIISCLR
jgi:lipid-A-disaccharide synthase